ncbi:UNKNOWN [Stylonychia lemnae]|uniref:Uncharacterized protein n=1 Tax=Stylonychia lemnae TaxID=5949 RepID=A0A078A7G5_STYLE|nr:UNKNOWN [Stylonychia lemnae]|eukprot:CDW77811.1 UNKNOWN [Stylonychia lemnae]
MKSPNYVQQLERQDSFYEDYDNNCESPGRGLGGGAAESRQNNEDDSYYELTEDDTQSLYSFRRSRRSLGNRSVLNNTTTAQDDNLIDRKIQQLMSKLNQQQIPEDDLIISNSQKQPPHNPMLKKGKLEINQKQIDFYNLQPPDLDPMMFLKQVTEPRKQSLGVGAVGIQQQIEQKESFRTPLIHKNPQIQAIELENVKESERLKQVLHKITEQSKIKPDLTKIRKIRRINITRPPSSNSKLVIETQNNDRVSEYSSQQVSTNLNSSNLKSISVQNSPKDTLKVIKRLEMHDSTIKKKQSFITKQIGSWPENEATINQENSQRREIKQIQEQLEAIKPKSLLNETISSMRGGFSNVSTVRHEMDSRVQGSIGLRSRGMDFDHLDQDHRDYLDDADQIEDILRKADQSLMQMRRMNPKGRVPSINQSNLSSIRQMNVPKQKRNSNSVLRSDVKGFINQHQEQKNEKEFKKMKQLISGQRSPSNIKMQRLADGFPALKTPVNFTSVKPKKYS